MIVGSGTVESIKTSARENTAVGEEREREEEEEEE
jgi:hypothetical protein